MELHVSIVQTTHYAAARAHVLVSVYLFTYYTTLVLIDKYVKEGVGYVEEIVV